MGKSQGYTAKHPTVHKIKAHIAKTIQPQMGVELTLSWTKIKSHQLKEGKSFSIFITMEISPLSDTSF
jgi:hypothetical protein